MALCSVCGKEIKENHIFCGYCGASVINMEKVVIDGRKNKKIKYIINRVCHFEKFNILLTVVFAVLLALSIFVTVENVKRSVMFGDNFSEVVNQLYFKYEYIKEGLGLSYLSREIAFIFEYVNNIILIIGGALGMLISAFYISFNTRILYLRKKYKESYSYKKPVRFIKICFYFTKLSVIAAIVLVLLELVIKLLKIIII